MATRRIVIDHLAVGVSDLERSRAFYTAALAPLGFEDLTSDGHADDEVPFGHREEGLDDFYIHTRAPVAGPIHIAFSADSREAVQGFHAAALEAGATDNGGPGFREDYSDGYYGAFVIDPDGHNVEAVFHELG